VMSGLFEKVLQSQEGPDALVERVFIERAPRNGLQLIVQGGFHGVLFSLTCGLRANAANCLIG
jgi:hypothetical protein